MENRQQLRHALRSRRRALSPKQQRQASRQLCRTLGNHLLFRRSRHIAVYLANDGEIDPHDLVLLAQSLGKTCYLPVLHPWLKRTLRFAQYRPGDPMVCNRFGIPEPRRSQRRLPPWLLQLVLMPLVGFDKRGGRLGMGGGFYDTTFAFKHQKMGARPTLIGLAHACQEVESLPLAHWDVPLNAIATDKHCFSTSSAIPDKTGL